MIQVKCIEKFRDRHNKICAYRLQDSNNQIKDVTPHDLKNAIRNKQIDVINLTLTSDGRIIGKNPDNYLVDSKNKQNEIIRVSSQSPFIISLLGLGKEIVDMLNKRYKYKFYSHIYMNPDVRSDVSDFDKINENENVVVVNEVFKEQNNKITRFNYLIPKKELKETMIALFIVSETNCNGEYYWLEIEPDYTTMNMYRILEHSEDTVCDSSKPHIRNMLNTVNNYFNYNDVVKYIKNNLKY